jgi:hypothetical protein
MTHDELVATVREMRDNAISIVRRYAAMRCPNVPDSTVRAIEGAMGEISIDEAFDVLDRLNTEILRR